MKCEMLSIVPKFPKTMLLKICDAFFANSCYASSLICIRFAYMLFSNDGRFISVHSQK